MNVARRTFILYTLLSALAIIPAFAQTPSSLPPDPRITSLLQMIGKTKTPMEVAISPDCATVAWPLRSHEGSQLHLTSIADPTKDQILNPPTATAGGANPAPPWSPDGNSPA